MKRFIPAIIIVIAGLIALAVLMPLAGLDSEQTNAIMTGFVLASVAVGFVISATRGHI